MDTESTKYEPILQQMAPGFFLYAQGAPVKSRRESQTTNWIWGSTIDKKKKIATQQQQNTGREERRGESALGSDERPPPSATSLVVFGVARSGTPAGRKTANGQNRQGGRRK
jgi:hypothetical protein